MITKLPHTTASVIFGPWGQTQRPWPQHSAGARSGPPHQQTNIHFFLSHSLVKKDQVIIYKLNFWTNYELLKNIKLNHLFRKFVLVKKANNSPLIFPIQKYIYLFHVYRCLVSKLNYQISLYM